MELKSPQPARLKSPQAARLKSPQPARLKSPLPALLKSPLPALLKAEIASNWLKNAAHLASFRMRPESFRLDKSIADPGSAH